MAGYVQLMPIRGGLVMTSRAGAVGRNVEAAGVYVVKNEKVTMMLAGMPHALAVSPDGCKVAVSIDVERKETARPRVNMIDVCLQGK
jgi:hypothetical protein